MFRVGSRIGVIIVGGFVCIVLFLSVFLFMFFFGWRSFFIVGYLISILNYYGFYIKGLEMNLV